MTRSAKLLGSFSVSHRGLARQAHQLGCARPSLASLPHPLTVVCPSSQKLMARWKLGSPLWPVGHLSDEKCEKVHSVRLQLVLDPPLIMRLHGPPLRLDKFGALLLLLDSLLKVVRFLAKRSDGRLFRCHASC